jgi:hypothetical protein
MQRHTCFRRTLHQQNDDDSESTPRKENRNKVAHNIDVIPCARDREVFAIVGETQV